MIQQIPSFLIIGAAKCGTTSLHHCLSAHQDIFLPSKKELHFFDDDKTYEKGRNAYLKHFKNERKYMAVGEATPAYLRLPDKVIPRIKEYFPDNSIKFIVLLRNPVERAWSHYLHRRRNMTEDLNFSDALKEEPKRLLKDRDKWVGYFRDGLYHEQLAKWFNAFGAESFIIILTEDLRNDSRAELKRIHSFISVKEIDYKMDIHTQKNMASKLRFQGAFKIIKKYFHKPIKLVVPVKIRRNIFHYLVSNLIKPINEKPQLSSEKKEHLYHKYLPSIIQLERLLQRDLSAWKH